MTEHAADPDESGSVEPEEVLRRARERVAALATEDGAFHVACAATGARPEPVAGVTFGSHEDARRAAAAARRYRAALRELDPELASYDLVVYGDEAGDVAVTCTRERTRGARPNGLPRARRVATLGGPHDGEWLRVENAPVVHLARDADPVGDEAVERQLDESL